MTNSSPPLEVGVVFHFSFLYTLWIAAVNDRLQEGLRDDVSQVARKFFFPLFSSCFFANQFYSRCLITLRTHTQTLHPTSPPLSAVTTKEQNNKDGNGYVNARNRRSVYIVTTP